MRSRQISICAKYGCEPAFPEEGTKLGISQSAVEGVLPLNGLRHPPEGSTNGWYIWGGEELSDDVNFFSALHVDHLSDVRPEVLHLLALPPGWRFLIADDYEDVWFDESLLNI